MNYQKIYDQLISKAQSENRKKNFGVYYENHHITPKCMGGSDEQANLILLTAREHFLAHWLLYRIYPNDSKLAFAFFRNCSHNTKLSNKVFTPSSRSFAEAREAHVKALKIQGPWNKGKKIINQKGSPRNNKETKDKLSQALKEFYKQNPNHVNKRNTGRVAWNKGLKKSA